MQFQIKLHQVVINTAMRHPNDLICAIPQTTKDLWCTVQEYDLSGFLWPKYLPILLIFSPILCVLAQIYNSFQDYFQDFSWKANHTPQCTPIETSWWFLREKSIAALKTKSMLCMHTEWISNCIDNTLKKKRNL